MKGIQTYLVLFEDDYKFQTNEQQSYVFLLTLKVLKKLKINKQNLNYYERPAISKIGNKGF